MSKSRKSAAPADSFSSASERFRVRPHGVSHGIELKKRYGQHFLRWQSVIDTMIEKVKITPDTPVFEIGCGDGFLTKSLIQTPLKKLWVFEIDADWAQYVRETYPDERMSIFEENILDIDFEQFSTFAQDAPWVLTANLPYQITFPILKKLQENRLLLSEGVIMVQEEVAQKIVAEPGDSSIQSLFYSYYFEWELLTKIPPEAFYPPPAVYSRLLYFKPRKELRDIPDAEQFWRFVKLCFMHRRRTLKNNIQQTHYETTQVPERFLKARAQELSLDDFLTLWDLLRKK